MDSNNELLQRIERLEKAVFGIESTEERQGIPNIDGKFSVFIGEVREKLQNLKEHFEKDDSIIFQAVLHNDKYAGNYHLTSLFTLDGEEKDEDIAAICNTFSSNQRISILRHLTKVELSSGELVETTKMAGGHLHHHLRELQSKKFIYKNEYGKYRATEYGLNVYLTIAALNRRLTYDERNDLNKEKNIEL